MLNSLTSPSWIASAVILCVLGPATVCAHGGPPAALGIVAADGRGPTLVSINEGLAIEQVTGWSYLCPSLWGDADTSAGKSPLALSLDGVNAWIIGARDLYAVRAGVLTAQAQPGMSRAHVIAVAATQDALFALRVVESTSQVVALGANGERPLWTSQSVWSAFAANADRLYLGGTLNERRMGFVTLNQQGEVLANVQLDVERVPSQIELRPSSQHLFVSMADSAQYTLALLDGALTTLLQSRAPIHGPQASASGQLWLAVDGALLRAELKDSTLHVEPIGESRVVTCLGQWGREAYACAGTELYRLTDTGLGDRLFELDRLSGPDPALVPASAARECEFQWLLLRNDLERSGLQPRDWDTPAFAGTAAVAMAAGSVAPPGAAGTASSLLSEPETTRRSSHACQAVMGHGPVGFHTAGLCWLGMIGSARFVGRRSQRRKAREPTRCSASSLPMKQLLSNDRTLRHRAFVALLLATVSWASVVLSEPARILLPPSASEASERTRRAQAVVSYTGGEVTVGELEDAIAVSSPLAQQSALAPEQLRALVDRSLRFELMAIEARERGYAHSERVMQAVKENSVRLMIDRDVSGEDRQAEIEALITQQRAAIGPRVHLQLLDAIRLDPEPEP